MDKLDYPWPKIFLDLALRAIIKAHHRYSIWGLGQGKLTSNDFEKLVQGNGILFAPEEFVRDEISQQIIEIGLWKEHEIDNEMRSYLIDREYQLKIPVNDFQRLDTYSKFNKPKSCEYKNFKIDLVFKRIQDYNKAGLPTYPVFIEAKRFCLVRVDLKSKDIEIGDFQKDEIDKDILKLKIIHDFHAETKFEVYGKQYEKIHTNILLWGVSHPNFNIEKEVVEKLVYSEYLTGHKIIKRHPIKWNRECTEIHEMIWVALLDLNFNNLYKSHFPA